MQNTLINYLRDSKRQPVGVVVAVKEEDEVLYGYSLCNPIDRWDRDKGLKIATARAIGLKTNGHYSLPKSSKNFDLVINGLKNIQKRASKYFKDIPAEKIDLKIYND